MSTAPWSFSPLSATPGISANSPVITLSWGYSNPSLANAQVQSITVYITDPLFNDNSDLTTTNVIPLRDLSNNLVTSYNISGLISGKQYLFMIEADGIVSNAYYNVVSNTVSCVLASKPPTPQTYLLAQQVGGQVLLSLSLSNTTYVPVTPASAYDGYSPLTAVTVLYNDKTNIRTLSFNNDSNNSLYGLNAMSVNGLPNKEFDFALRLQNALGRSSYSPSRNFTVAVPIPGAPLNLQGIPTMLIDPSFVPSSNPSISLSWQSPSVLGDPSLNSYTVSRNGQPLATLTRDPSGVIPITYVDASNLVAGVQYRYTVASNSASTGVNDVVANSSSVNVMAVNPPAIIGTPVVTAGNNSFSVDVSYNPNGFSQNQVSFDLSGNRGIGLQNFTTDPFTVTNLANGPPGYNSAVRIKGTINGLSFNSAFTALPNIIPFAPLLPLSNVVITNVDGSGVPLNNKLNLSWTYPTALPSYQVNNIQTVYIYRKLSSSPDSSYSLISNTLNSPNGLFFQDVSVNNGISYSYKLENSQANPNGGNLNFSSSVVVSSTPFSPPGQVRSLNFVDASMSYSFLPPTNNGGLQISGYMLTLSNVSNGGNVLVESINLTARDLSGSLITYGNLSQYTQPGRAYNLSVQAYVTNNNSNILGAAANSVAYSRPAALAAPVVSNVDGSLNPVLGGNALLVNWAINAGYDASAAKYAIYRNGSILPLPDASNLLTTSYTNTSLTNGSPNYYQVQIILGTTSSPLSPVSNTAVPFSYPANVTNLIYTVLDSSSVNLSWTPSNLNGTGITQNNVSYRVFDLSNNTLLSSGNTNSRVITKLQPGVNYLLGVQVGALVNGIVYYSNLTTPQINVATYEIPINSPQGLNIYPSNASALVDITEARSYSGLSFRRYIYRWRPDTPGTGFNGGIYTTSSAQYLPAGQQPSLDNFSTYEVEVLLEYADVLNNIILSAPVRAFVTPETAPNQPTGLELISSTPNQLNLRWNVAADATHYTLYRSNASGNIGDPIFSNIRAVPGGILNPVNSNTKWSFIDANVTAGQTNYYSLVAIKEANSLYVSSQSAPISGLAYSAPSSPRNLSYTPGNGNVTITWSPPSSTAGANAGNNGPLYYQLTIVGPSGETGIFTDITATSLVISNFTDASGNLTVSLVNGSIYNVSVVAVFNIQNDPTNKSVSAPSSVTAQPRGLPMTPVATAVASNTNSAGKQIRLTLRIDPASVINNTKVYVTRVIRDVCGNTLSTVSNQLLAGLVFDGSFSTTIIDSPNSNIANDPDNFLNGNNMSYIFNVQNSNWTVSNTVSTDSNQVNAVPSGQPIISSLTIGSNGSLNVNINKNGGSASPNNALVALGFDTVGEYTVKVEQVPASAISFSNNQQNGNVAKNQLASYTFAPSVWAPNPIQKALIIFATDTGNALLDTPTRSVLG